MAELITIPIAVFDVSVEYVRPNMKLLMDRAAVVSEMFERYRPWNVKIDDVEVITEGKPSEQGIKFKLPANRTSFFFGAALCKLTRDDADWESAEETIKILDIGLRTLVEVAGVEVGCFKTAIALHLQPKTMPFMELLKPFASAPIAALDGSPLKAFATVLRWEKRRITIDGSSQIANGVFLRFERELPGSATFEEIAKQLKLDEDELFEMLGVQEDRP
jgi:hypothetical protein